MVLNFFFLHLLHNLLSFTLMHGKGLLVWRPFYFDKQQKELVSERSVKGAQPEYNQEDRRKSVCARGVGWGGGNKEK